MAKKSTKKKPVLNTQPLPTADSIEDLSILLYGFEKIGKTTFARCFKKPYFLFTEPGHKSLPEPTYGTLVSNWREFRDTVKLVCESDDFNTVVVDTVDLAHEMCSDYVCKKLCIEHPSDEEWGKGWKAVEKEFSSVVRLLQRSKGTVFLSHAKEVEIRGAIGNQRHRVVPTMNGSARRIIEPAVDVWMAYTYTPKGDRCLILRGDLDIAAGTRCKDKFVGCDVLYAGKSEDEAYKNFLLAYRNSDSARKLNKDGSRIKSAKTKGDSR